ncbi:MAG: methyltransferase, TrmH family [Chloroflexota bacterium]|nr:methyltransferase, TrmH family [Chloroflexota bacterium]
MAEIITSTHNPAVQRVRELLAQRKKREQEQAYVIEGVRLAEEALAAGRKPGLVLYSQSISERGRDLLSQVDPHSTRIEEVETGLLDRLSATTTSQGLLMVLERQQSEQLLFGDPVLVLDQMRDPGNLGTILRGACAFGFRTVLLTPGSVDPYSPKVLRAAMGAHFKLHVDTRDAAQIRALCHPGSIADLRILLADAQAEQSCWQADLAQPLCLIIGGEAFGAQADIQAITDQSILIPMQANNESLNAAMAASILMYEVYRQRNLK